MEAIGVRVQAQRADITNYEEMSDLFDRYRTSNIKGIFHLAGVLDDGILIQQDRMKFEKVMAPKLEGAWNLHLLSRKLSLDFFIMYSSAASVLGSSAQGNYAAANAFLDALAHYRQKLGLPGTSINWGPWDQAGMAAELTSSARHRLSQLGLLMIPPEQGLTALEYIMQSDETQVSVIPVEWPKFFDQFAKDEFPLFFADMPKELRQEISQTKQNKDKDTVQASPFVSALRKAQAESRSKMLSAFVQKTAIRASGFETVQMNRPLMDQGFDSLIMVELRNHLSKELGIRLSPVLAFDYPTIIEISEYLETRLIKTSTKNDTDKLAEEKESKSEFDYLNDLNDEELMRMMEKDLTI